MIPESDRTIIIPEHIYLILEEMAAEERKREKNPVLKSLKTPLALAQRMLKEGCGK
jgi:hypothetical protein